MHALNRIVCGLILTIAVGCQSYGPYSPYGMAPGYYSQPNGAIAPQGPTFMPPAGATGPSPQLGPGTTVAPNSSGQWSGSGAGAGSTNSTYEPAGEGTNKPVPTYSDDSLNDSSASSTNRFDSTTDFGSDGAFGRGQSNPGATSPQGTSTAPKSTGAPAGDTRSFDSEATPFEPSSNPTSNSDPIEPFSSRTPTGVKLDFEEPEAESFQEPFRPASNSVTTTTARPNPYDYDREKYTWLRGVVDFDDEQQTWHIIYNLKPNKHDRYGGSSTLASSPQLKGLQPNDIVLVEGRFDPSAPDNIGKPTYQVDHVARLVPKAN